MLEPKYIIGGKMKKCTRWQNDETGEVYFKAHVTGIGATPQVVLTQKSYDECMQYVGREVVMEGELDINPKNNVAKLIFGTVKNAK